MAPVPPANAGQAIHTNVMWIFIKVLSGFGQYVLPGLFLFGAGVSALRRQSRQRLFDEAAQRGAAAKVVNGLSWQQFELLIGEAFRREGWRVQEAGGGGADGGVDLRLSKDGETFLVQCKHWRAWRVGVEVVRELYGVMAAEGAVGGFVVSSGRFTDEARAFAEGRNVRLVDGEELKTMLERARGSDVPRERAAIGAAIGGAIEPAMRFQSAAPRCPVCAGVMERRRAQREAHAGLEFWGCSQFPACRGTRSVG
jgi:restriction system protein